MALSFGYDRAEGVRWIRIRVRYLFPWLARRGNTIFENNLIRKIVKNSSIILSGNLASSALGFVSFAILASSLGPDLLAYFALAQVYAFIMNDLFNVQTWESLIKFGTKQDDSNRLARTIKTNVLIDIVSAFVAFTIATLLVQEIGAALQWDDTLVGLAYLYCFIIPFTLTTFTIGIPRLYNKFAVIAKIQFAMAVLKLILVSIISYLESDVRAFTAVYIAVDILINISLSTYSLFLLRRNNVLSWKHTKLHLTREQIKFLWWTNLRTVARIPVRKLDVLIINQVMSMNTVGVYKVYKEIVGIIGLLGEPINQAIYPEYTKLLGKGKSSETVLVTKRIMRILLLVAFVAMTAFIITSEFIIELAFGVEYLIFMTAFYLLVVLNSISLFLTPINSLFIAAGFAKYSFYIVLANNILYLSVALLGGMYFGIYGVVLAYGVQMVFNKGMKIVFLKKHPTGWGSVIR